MKALITFTKGQRTTTLEITNILPPTQVCACYVIHPIEGGTLYIEPRAIETIQTWPTELV